VLDQLDHTGPLAFSCLDDIRLNHPIPGSTIDAHF
jgi:hypothetical protein